MYGQTESEMVMVGEINEIRKNPKSYIPKVEKYIRSAESMLSMYDNKNVTINTKSVSGGSTKTNDMKNGKTINGKDVFIQRIEAAKELILILDTLQSMDTLVFDSTMYPITITHGKYVEKTGKIGHYGPNGTKPLDRFGYDVGENLTNGGNRGLISLMVDAGVYTRGHRKNILNRNYKEISIYISDFVVVQNFK
jgi:hypothetical protein